MGNTIDSLKEPVTKKDTLRGEIAEGAYKKNAEGKSKKERDLMLQRIPFAVSSMQGWRLTMEDYHTMESSLSIPPCDEEGYYRTTILRNHSLFGVYDGHGGSFTSQYLGENMVRVLTQRKEWYAYLDLSEKERGDVPGIELLKQALNECFFDIDRELQHLHHQRVEAARKKEREEEALRNKVNLAPGGQDEPGHLEVGLDGKANTGSTSPATRLDRSGSTGTLVLVTPTHILCSNAGDSRALLCRTTGAYPLSFDHKPTNAVESSRIRSAGGAVRLRRVDGDLAVSRGLGDFRFKDNVQLSPEKQKVTAKPDVMILPRNVLQDQFVVVACDGIWDVLSNNDCSKLLKTLVLEEGEGDVGLVCEEILDQCLAKNSRDNMTVAVVAFPCSGINSNKTGVEALVGDLTGDVRRSATSPSSTSLNAVAAKSKVGMAAARSGGVLARRRARGTAHTSSSTAASSTLASWKAATSTSTTTPAAPKSAPVTLSTSSPTSTIASFSTSQQQPKSNVPQSGTATRSTNSTAASRNAASAPSPTPTPKATSPAAPPTSKVALNKRQQHLQQARHYQRALGSKSAAQQQQQQQQQQQTTVSGANPAGAAAARRARAAARGAAVPATSPTVRAAKGPSYRKTSTNGTTTKVTLQSSNNSVDGMTTEVIMVTSRDDED